MSVFLALVLGIVQGLTEFLPVSSSGHLVLSRHLLAESLGSLENPLALDVLLHLATGLVTVVYLRKDIGWLLSNLLSGGFRIGGFRKGADSERDTLQARKLTLSVLVASLPAILVALTAKDMIEKSFTSIDVALNGFLLTSLFLAFAHFRKVKLGKAANPDSLLSWEIPGLFSALLIGCAQALAILPGVSRSGSTIACALLLGFSSTTSVRFSFFMFLPVVFGAVLLEAGALLRLSADNGMALLLAVTSCVIAAYFALRCLVWIVEGSRLIYFAGYTFLLSMLFRVL